MNEMKQKELWQLAFSDLLVLVSSTALPWSSSSHVSFVFFCSILNSILNPPPAASPQVGPCSGRETGVDCSKSSGGWCASGPYIPPPVECSSQAGLQHLPMNDYWLFCGSPVLKSCPFPLQRCRYHAGLVALGDWFLSTSILGFVRIPCHLILREILSKGF